MSSRCATQWALNIFMFSLAFESINLLPEFGGGLSVGRITGLAYGVFVLAAGYPILLRKWTPVFALLAILLMAFLIPGVSNYSGQFPKLIDLTFFQNIVLLFLVLSHDHKAPGALNRGFLFYALGFSVLGLFYFFDIGIEYQYGRLNIFGDDSNYSSIKSGIAVVILVYEVIYRRRTGLVFAAYALASILVMLNLIFDTASRSGIASLIIMLIAFVFFYARRVGVQRLFQPALYVVALAAVMLSLFQSSELMRFRLMNALESNDLSERDSIWRSFADASGWDLVVGRGYSGYYELSHQLFASYKSTHNVLVEVFVLGGIVGLTVFFLFNLVVVFIAVKNYRVSGDPLGIVLLISYAICLVSLQFFTLKILWLIIGLNCVSSPRLDSAKQPSVGSL